MYPGIFPGRNISRGGKCSAEEYIWERECARGMKYVSGHISGGR